MRGVAHEEESYTKLSGLIFRTGRTVRLQHVKDMLVAASLSIKSEMTGENN